MHDNQLHEIAAAEAVLARTEQLRRDARRDTRALAVPLLVLGLLTLGYAVVSYVEQNVIASDLGPGQSRSATDAELQFGQFADTYWGLAGAAGLLVIGLWMGVRSRRLGAGAGAGAWVAGGFGLFLLASVVPFSPLSVMIGMVGFMAPTAFIGIALLVIAWRRRDPRLAVWTVVFGLVVTLAHLGFFTNRLADLLRVTGLTDSVDVHVLVQADLVVLAVLGLILIGAAVRDRRTGAATRRDHEPVLS